MGVVAREVGEKVSGLDLTLSSALSGRFAANAARIHELASPFANEQFWQKPFPFGNSFGHLVLHLTGNLNYYVGARIAETGYVRDRVQEFNDPNPPPKEAALRRLHDAVAMVITTIGQQPPEDWSASYSGVGTNCSNRLEIVIQCEAHMQHHIGQMIYLGCEWQRRTRP